MNNLLDTNAGVMVVAHRACWKDAPENSLKSIQSCIELGVDMVELDVRRTADHVLILMHDETVDRTTDGTGNVSDLTYEEVQVLTLKNHDGGDFSAITNSKVPTFREALALSRDQVLVNVDAKDDVFEAAMREVEELDMLNQVVIKMEVPPDDPVLSKLTLLKKVNFMPKITEGAGELGSLVPLYTFTNPVAFEVKARTESYLAEGSDEIEAMGARLWVNTLSVSPEKAAGHIDALALHNPDLHWGRLIELGVDMIQTDEPAALLEYLESEGLH